MINSLNLFLVVITLLNSLSSVSLQAKNIEKPVDVKALKKRSSNGDLEAKVMLADYSRKSKHGIKYHAPSIFNAYKQAAEANLAEGHHGLAVCYLKSIGTTFSPTKCLFHAKKATNLNSSNGKLILAICYCDGFHLAESGKQYNSNTKLVKRTKEGITKAIKLWTECANQGNQMAAYNIQITKINNYSILFPNQKKLAYSCKKDGINGIIQLGKENHPSALHSLGTFNLFGQHGYRVNSSKAIEYYKRAAALNNIRSIYQLGAINRSLGNLTKGLEYQKLAAQRGYPVAITQLAQYYYENPEQQEQPNQWKTYAAKSIKLRYSKGHEIFGLFFADKSLPTFNPKLSHKHFIKAVELNSWQTTKKELSTSSKIKVAQHISIGWDGYKADPELAANFLLRNALSYKNRGSNTPFYKALVNLITTSPSLKNNPYVRSRAIKIFSSTNRQLNRSQNLCDWALIQLNKNFQLTEHHKNLIKEVHNSSPFFPKKSTLNPLHPGKQFPIEAYCVARSNTRTTVYGDPGSLKSPITYKYGKTTNNIDLAIKYYKIALDANEKTIIKSNKITNANFSGIVKTISGRYLDKKPIYPTESLNDPQSAVNFAYRYILSKEPGSVNFLTEIKPILAPYNKRNRFPQINDETGPILAYYCFLLREKHCGKITHKYTIGMFEHIKKQKGVVAKAQQMLKNRSHSKLPFPEAKDYFYTKKTDPGMHP